MANLKPNRPRTIIDLITYDPSTFFLSDDYIEIHSEDEQGTIMIDYEKSLPWTEQGLFDSVIFRMFTDKTNITGGNHINATFLARNTSVDKTKFIDFLKKLIDIYGLDDNGHSDWGQDDEKLLKEGNPVERIWTSGKDKELYSIKLTFDLKQGAVVKIFFLNRLLKLVGKV